jgi:hypothetical protein
MTQLTERSCDFSTVIVIAPSAVLTHAQPAPVFYTKTAYTTGSWLIMPFFFSATKRFAFPGAVAK